MSLMPVAELLGRDPQIFTDIEESLHGGKGFPIFNPIDIALVLPNGKAHLPGGYLFRLPQLGQSTGKDIFIHALTPPMVLYIIGGKL